ncbi:AbfB domain-containing protein [Streptomyces pratensis]|uniref:AbfB domain-containing protein n=1 Tax=Streptomyces pratensis TaxID=1169025 RepID=UPI00362523BC
MWVVPCVGHHPRHAQRDWLKADATYTVRRGLADSSCYSFESVNFPGQYLRHAAGRVRNSPNDNTALFREDATFCSRPGLSGTGVTLESFNQPGSFLRHFESQVHIADGGSSEGFNRPQTITADATWTLANPWTP